MTVDGMECEKGREIGAEVSHLLLTTYYLLLTPTIYVGWRRCAVVLCPVVVWVFCETFPVKSIYKLLLAPNLYAE